MMDGDWVLLCCWLSEGLDRGDSFGDGVTRFMVGWLTVSAKRAKPARGDD